MKYLFSIVTVSFNQVQYLQQCIESILGQAVPVEYIVMDGGSTDGSKDLIKKYEDRIAYWISEKDNGAADALNKGFDKATGEYIGYINSDDYLLPDALAQLSMIMLRNPGYDVYYGPGYIKYEQTGKMEPVYPTKWNLGTYRYGWCVMMQQSMFIRKKFLQKSGVRFSDAKTAWDGEHLVDMDLAGATFFRHRHPLSVFRIHHDSITGGVEGAEGQQKYLQHVQLLHQKIDRLRPGLIRNRWYWLCKLLVTDPLTMTRRLIQKL